MALLLHILLLTSLLLPCIGQRKPNILFLLVDDLGYNDVGYHDNTVKSPVIDGLAAEGVILENNYVAPSCVPSRSALLTGRYPFHVGMQHDILSVRHPQCLTRGNPLLPEALKSLGYNTYMLGKWGVGFCNVNCTPNLRGFDQFYGYYTNFISHFGHMSSAGFDFQENLASDVDTAGQYAAQLFGSRAEKYIDNHLSNDRTRDNPFYMYFAFPTVHDPLEAPTDHIMRHTNESDVNRRIIKAMVSVTDDIIGSLVRKLKATGLYENTIIIFSSDNGGELQWSSNYPLRGSKFTNFEGAVRVPGFVHSPLLKTSAGTVSWELFHQTDWYPTIVSLAGGAVPDFVDGFDQTDLIINGGKSSRSVIPIHYDQLSLFPLGSGAIRAGKWKLIQGYPGRHDGYNTIFSGPDALHPVSEGDFRASCSSTDPYLLFDLEADPSERTNLADVYPQIVAELKALLQEFADTAVEPFDNTRVERDVVNQNGIVTSGWC